MRHEGAPGALYPRLMGAQWLQLAEPVRFAHTPESTVRGSGRLRVAQGSSPLARVLAWLLRLPRASEAAETRLVVTSSAGGERWLRTFGGRRLDSRQYQVGDGELAERFGVLEFRFRLEASEGSLLFRQVGAGFVWGSVRLRLPERWAPRVDAREDPMSARRIRVHVHVTLPGLGPVLSYEGPIDFEEGDRP
jgi:hypothetical protein